MIATKKRKFGQALAEGISLRLAVEFEGCTEDSLCSKEHIEKVMKIAKIKLNNQKGKPVQSERRNPTILWRHRFVFLALIVASLSFVSCSVYAYREEIRDFIEEIYDEHIKVTFDDSKGQGSSSYIAEVYSLGYVPEGYELVDKTVNPLSVQYEWRNLDNDVIIFRQLNLDDTNFTLDNESGYIAVLRHGNYEIYCSVYGDLYDYIWNDGKYGFMLQSTIEMDFDELVSILDSVTIN